jgi:hypothetical protein
MKKYILLSLFLYTNLYSIEKIKPRIIELYSSEGCSSCPKDELKMSSWIHHKDLWSTFIPINFRVDYWNYLGWKDRFSKKEFSERQRKLSFLNYNPNVYTPETFIDSKETELPLDPTKDFIKSEQIIEHQIKKNSIKVKLKSKIPNSKLFFVLLGNGITSKITSGENKGKTYLYNFVVLDYQVKQNQELNIPEIEFKIVDVSENLKSKGYAIWLTDESHKPIDSVGGFLD